MSSKPREAAAPTEPLRAVLAELVACKDLKHRFQNMRFAKMTAESEVLAREYDRRQPLAWEAARTALATAEPAKQTEEKS